MKVFQIQGDWGMDHLQLATRPEPKPGPGEVLMRMKAAALNYRDLLVPNRGYGSFTGNLPLIPLSDGVGEVVEVGAGVTRVKVGDRASPCFQQGWIAGEPDLERITKTMGGPVDGTYYVNADCTGGQTTFIPIPGVPPLEDRFVIVDNGREVRTVVVSPLTTVASANLRKK